MARSAGLSWPGIARLSLVQVAIGAVVVLMTSTLNRVMVVELGLAAAVPGALVALHFFVQLLRPQMGFGSDGSGRRIPWIVGGMALVSLSGVGAAAGTALMAVSRPAGLALALLSFLLLGVGVSAASTPLLAYLAERVEEPRMAGAAAVAWIMMIVGIILTAGFAGTLLDPFSGERLVQVTAGVCGIAFVLTLLGVVGRRGEKPLDRGAAEPVETSFREAFAVMWNEPEARRFATFVFVSMLAYSAQDIILEPFAGVVFGLTPGESTRIAGLQHGGVLIGMILGAIAAARVGTLRLWSAFGCAASGVALVALVATPALGSVAGLKAAVFGLGFSNGVFAVAAIGAMMGLTVAGGRGGAGLRMGFWGAAQAVAYGLGGFLGAGASDVARSYFGSPVLGYTAVFGAEALLFGAAAILVLGVRTAERRSTAPLAAARLAVGA
ncbi:MAG: BCD family MFS transporter [Gemmatimonadota bacterium]|nr:BCD family MFS transporter [Gemmatimonadota bacterium]